ncbi:MAG: histidine phosphatase family protein [Dehalococcoidia bacterium]|nr:histidine phosphatase family protein [Dehalococcoidia bacterium]
MPARWYLVRHGETEWNRADRAQGHADVPLNDAGREQAHALAKAVGGMRFDAAFTSDLSRATETARILLNGGAPQPVVTADLRELSYGRWEGFTFADAERDDPTLFVKLVNADPDFVAPGGESFQQLMARVQTFAERTRATHPEGTLLVVAHGGSLRALAVAMLHLPQESFRQLRLTAASLSVLEVRERSSTLLRWNDTSHYQHPLHAPRAARAANTSAPLPIIEDAGLPLSQAKGEGVQSSPFPFREGGQGVRSEATP